MLTKRQAAFSREYLRDFNATQAAIRAGYRPAGASVRGSELLKHPEVSAAIAIGTTAHAEQADVEAGAVIRELAQVAFSTPDGPLKTSDKTKALELLMRHLGLLDQRLHVDVNLERLTDEQAQALELLKRTGVI